jgi:hypothetical protein
MCWSRSVVVNMPACHAGDRGFESRRDRHFFRVGSVAQSVEHERVSFIGITSAYRSSYFLSKLSESGTKDDKKDKTCNDV